MWILFYEINKKQSGGRSFFSEIAIADWLSQLNWSLSPTIRSSYASTVLFSLISIIDGRQQLSSLGSWQQAKIVYMTTDYVGVNTHYERRTLCLGIKPTLWSVNFAREILTTEPYANSVISGPVATVNLFAIEPLKWQRLATCANTALSNPRWVTALIATKIERVRNDPRAKKHGKLAFTYKTEAGLTTWL